MTEVLLIDPFRKTDLDKFSDMEGYHFSWVQNPNPKDIENAEIIFGLPSISLFRYAQKTKWIQLPMAGVDYYSKNKDSFPKEIMLTNLSGAFGSPISEYILTMCLNLYKNMPKYHAHQLKHKWADVGRQYTPANKNVLILGIGDIGSKTAKLFKAFGCHIVGMCHTMRDVPLEFDKLITIESLDEYLPLADIVIGALPSTPLTRNMFDYERLSKLKKSSILINVGRGDLIVTDDLIKCLKENKIMGAALDVVNPEPLPKDSPLWDFPNVIILPHATGGTFGHSEYTESVLFDLCRKNLLRYQNGESLLNMVDLNIGYRSSSNKYIPNEKNLISVF